MLTADERSRLDRVIAVKNRKGGVGKTTIATNLAGEVARGGRRVLLIDLDDQANAGLNLGYFDAEEYDDRGKALFEALVMDTELVPTKGIRENLDVVPAGEYTAKLEALMMAQGMQGQATDTSDVLGRKLAEISSNYDLILLDCPPRTGVIDKLVMTAAKWLIVPSDLDDGAALGLEYLLEEVTRTRESANPSIGVLGVVMIPVPTGATVLIAEQREALTRALRTAGEQQAPVFETTIRDAVKAATQARRRGQLVHELARDKSKQAPWYQRIKSSSSEGEIARSAEPLADDFRVLKNEVMHRLTEAEAPVAKTRREQKEKRNSA